MIHKVLPQIFRRRHRTARVARAVAGANAVSNLRALVHAVALAHEVDGFVQHDLVARRRLLRKGCLRKGPFNQRVDISARPKQLVQ